MEFLNLMSFVCFVSGFGSGSGVTLMGLHGLSCVWGWMSPWVVAGVWANENGRE